MSIDTTNNTPTLTPIAGWPVDTLEWMVDPDYKPAFTLDEARGAMAAVLRQYPDLGRKGFRNKSDSDRDFATRRANLENVNELMKFTVLCTEMQQMTTRGTINPANTSSRFGGEIFNNMAVRRGDQPANLEVESGAVIAAAAHLSIDFMRVPTAGYVLMPFDVGEHSPGHFRLAVECTKEGWAAEHGIDPADVGEPPHEGTDKWELRTTSWGNSCWWRRTERGTRELHPWWPVDGAPPPAGPIVIPHEIQVELDCEEAELELGLAELRKARAAAADPDDDFSDLDSAIETLNRKYAAVNENGEFRIFSVVDDAVFRRKRLERISEASFHQMFANRPVTVSTGNGTTYKEITKSASKWWMVDRRRKQYLNGVAFDPSGKLGDGYWNLWQGWPIEPAPGDWSLIDEHIYDVICSGDDDLYQYVLRWMARAVQHPEQPGEVAIVLRGKKGCGKGTLGNLLGDIFGQHGIHITNPKHLVGNFNAHLRDCVYMFADEAFFAGDKSHDGILKGLITEPVITVEAKHQNAVTVRNCLHVLMASNSDYVVPATEDERRYCVIDVPPARIGDREYFKRLKAQIKDGGAAAMLHDLLELDLTDFNHRDYPETAALDDQKLLNMDSLHRWWRSVLERGYVLRSRHGAPIFAAWHPFVATQLLGESYQQFCAANRIMYPVDETRIGKMMAAMYQGARPGGSHPVREIDCPDRTLQIFAEMKERPTGYMVGSLDEARESFCNKLGFAIDWEYAAAA